MESDLEGNLAKADSSGFKNAVYLAQKMMKLVNMLEDFLHDDQIDAVIPERKFGAISYNIDRGGISDFQIHHFRIPRGSGTDVETNGTLAQRGQQILQCQPNSAGAILVSIDLFDEPVLQTISPGHLRPEPLCLPVPKFFSAPDPVAAFFDGRFPSTVFR